MKDKKREFDSEISSLSADKAITEDNKRIFRDFIKFKSLPSRTKVTDSNRLVVWDRGRALDRIREKYSGRMPRVRQRS